MQSHRGRAIVSLAGVSPSPTAARWLRVDPGSDMFGSLQDRVAGNPDDSSPDAHLVYQTTPPAIRAKVVIGEVPDLDTVVVAESMPPAEFSERAEAIFVAAGLRPIKFRCDFDIAVRRAGAYLYKAGRYSAANGIVFTTTFEWYASVQEHWKATNTWPTPSFELPDPALPVQGTKFEKTRVIIWAFQSVLGLSTAAFDRESWLAIKRSVRWRLENSWNGAFDATRITSEQPPIDYRREIPVYLGFHPIISAYYPRFGPHMAKQLATRTPEERELFYMVQTEVAQGSQKTAQKSDLMVRSIQALVKRAKKPMNETTFGYALAQYVLHVPETPKEWRSYKWFRAVLVWTPLMMRGSELIELSVERQFLDNTDPSRIRSEIFTAQLRIEKYTAAIEKLREDPTVTIHLWRKRLPGHQDGYTISDIQELILHERIELARLEKELTLAKWAE